MLGDGKEKAPEIRGLVFYMAERGGFRYPQAP